MYSLNQMDYALIFFIFAAVVALIVLRYTAIFRQMASRNADLQSQALKTVEASHVAAFSNAMTALSTVQARIQDGQMAMFERTTDMIHGPQQPPAENGYTVDEPRFDHRADWQPDDDSEEARRLLYADPTDDLMPDPPIEPEGDEHRAVSVRPGEGLIPQ